MKCDPREWVGLGFVATIANAPGEVLTQIDGISSVAAQIAWGVNAQQPEVMEDYLLDLADWDLIPVGWGWCDAEDPAGAKLEGLAHARIAANLPITRYIANMEEPYDAHGDINNPKWNLPDAYCEAFRSILPDMAFAVTTTPRWASNHRSLQEAGAVLMPQAFSLAAPDPWSGATVDACCKFSADYGWTMDRVRPLVQVYETEGKVPLAQPYLDESEEWGVGVIPYILEQALGGQGRDLLNALVPAITRQPMAAPAPPTNGDDDMVIGKQHGIVAMYNRLKALDPEGANPAFNPERPFDTPLDEMKAYDKWCRTMTILVSDHDANI